MRKKWDEQLSISHFLPRNRVAKELTAISAILDAHSEFLEVAYKDLSKARVDTGRDGMTAEQVLRCAALKQYRSLTYEELEFHLQDSQSFRAFARLRMGEYPSASTLQENIKALSIDTWMAVHEANLRYAETQGWEKGRKTRMDSTAVETNIHRPTDSTLLQDGIRIITRWLAEGQELRPMPAYSFTDHNRRAKKRCLEILNTQKEAVREKAYQDLLNLAGCVRGYALAAIPVLYGYVHEDEAQRLQAQALAKKLEEAVGILKQVIGQTERRVLHGEKVPADEKVVSFFERHTDIIVKGRRQTRYGHKVFLTGGATGLILDCVIERGNPSDTALFPVLLERQEKLYDRPPRQVSADGGFASKENLRDAKGRGVRDVAFAKKKGLSVLEMVKSYWVYKKLKNFRAGIEANISRLKRSFGLSRCDWRGWLGFQKYVWSSIVSYNLLVLARLKMAA
ncbi:MAG: ISNCY family transposase [Syntrophales bacterium]